MRKRNESLLKEYHQWTRPAKEFGYQDDQKRLWNEFGSKDIQLRYHTRKKVCQVWYYSPVDFYFIYEVAAPYDICKAIKFMKDKERSRREHYAVYKELLDLEERERKTKVKEVATEVGTAMKNTMQGKVSVLMR